jgi:L-ascorbate metabolism protein UlaG (beta-lactamase superfamily)
MARPSGPFKVEVTWLWRAAFKLVTPEGRIVFIDPWLKNNPLCPPAYKEIGKQKADVIVFTHAHHDHIGDTVELAKSTGATVAGAVDMRAMFLEKGLDLSRLVMLSYGGTGCAGDVSISMVPAWHTSPPSWGVVLRFSNGFTVYHTGDTCLFSDMALVKELYAPHLVLIPVGDVYTMDPRAANLACRNYIQPQYAIPMHYPGILTDTTPSDLGERFRQQMDGSGIAVIVMKPGETVRF